MDEECKGGTCRRLFERVGKAETKIYPTKEAPDNIRDKYKDGAPVCSPCAGNYINGYDFGSGIVIQKGWWSEQPETKSL